MKKKLTALLLILLLIPAAAYFLYYPVVKACCSSPYRTFQSPDKEYQVIVHFVPLIPVMMPGSTGDMPGYVELRHASGTTLQEKRAEMVSLVDNVIWEQDSVYIKLFAEWNLNRNQ